MLLEKTLGSLLNCKEIRADNPKRNQPWIFTGRTVAEAPIMWLPYVKCWLIGKDPDAGKDWRQEEKGVTEDEMVGWHHWLNGHEFEQAPGDGDGQGNLVWYSPWGQRVGHSLVFEQQCWLTKGQINEQNPGCTEYTRLLASNQVLFVIPHRWESSGDYEEFTE